MYHSICQQSLRENHKTSVRLVGHYAKICTRDQNLPNNKHCQPVHCSIQYSNCKDQQTLPDNTPLLCYHKVRVHDNVHCLETENYKWLIQDTSYDTQKYQNTSAIWICRRKDRTEYSFCIYTTTSTSINCTRVCTYTYIQ